MDSILDAIGNTPLVRGGLTGFHESPVWLSLLVAGGIAAAAFAAAKALSGVGGG